MWWYISDVGLLFCSSQMIDLVCFLNHFSCPPLSVCLSVVMLFFSLIESSALFISISAFLFCDLRLLCVLREMSDECLHLHQIYLERLEGKLAKLRPILDLIKKREEVVHEKVRLGCLFFSCLMWWVCLPSVSRPIYPWFFWRALLSSLSWSKTSFSTELFSSDSVICSFSIACILSHRITLQLEFECQSADPTRLFQRDPGRLLREENMRKRFRSFIPRVNSDLDKALKEWEHESGCPFMYGGVRYAPTLTHSLIRPLVLFCSSLGECYRSR